ncbi:MAG: hypothetical protein JRE64_05455 [Deltaproteobacteria bacterium]|nr:hypothetical protein [Deltaproteobacteria bacterium]
MREFLNTFPNSNDQIKLMKNILVTSANGFIGKVHCDKLLADVLYQVRGAVKSAAQMAAIPSGVEGVTDWSEALSGIEGIEHLAAKTNPPTNRSSASSKARRPGARWHVTSVLSAGATVRGRHGFSNSGHECHELDSN